MTRHNEKGLLRDRRGAVAAWVALMLVMLFGIAALAVDMGFLWVMRNRLQATADAAALAGASQLGVDEATVKDKAVAYAQKNLPPGSHGTALADADVVLGHWDGDTRTFIPKGTTAAQGTACSNPVPLETDPNCLPLDAVKVTTRRAEVNGNPAQLFFAPVLGIRTADVVTAAIAEWYGGGGDNTCFQEGILAGGEVTLGSDGVFVNNFCIYGREGVTLVSGPVVEEGVTIAALDSAACNPAGCSDCGTQCGTINFESHECYVPEGTYLNMPPEDCDAACAAAHDGYADRLEWLQANGLCGPVQPAMSYGIDIQPEQANDISTIIDGIGIGYPPQITNVVEIGTLGVPGPISFEMENPMTSEIRNLQGYTLPPPGDIVPGTAYIINGNFYVDNEIYNLTNNIVAVRGNAYFDGGAFRNTAPCEGGGNYKLGFYATEDLYVRDVATGVDLIGGNDVLIGENFNEFEPGPHDVSVQAGNDVFIDEDGHYLRCPDRIKSYEAPVGPVAGRPRLVD